MQFFSYNEYEYYDSYKHNTCETTVKVKAVLSSHQLFSGMPIR